MGWRDHVRLIALRSGDNVTNEALPRRQQLSWKSPNHLWKLVTTAASLMTEQFPMHSKSIDIVSRAASV
ncbi:hypothetical protein GCK32_005210 [Trichostrongylus colubriformis]|uniref:Uncharacterized protein n=1 Tax=Trichostrongylus colubriformis TaxID=6319 RepID=A0AAN8IM06_TRICO